MNKNRGRSCIAVGCRMRPNTNLFSKIKMYHFPTNPYRRRLWQEAVNRENWTATNNSRLCSRHFITGCPTKDPNHPDFVPSIFEHTTKEASDLALQRYLAYTENNNIKNEIKKYSTSTKKKPDKNKDGIIKLEEGDIKVPTIISLVASPKDPISDSEETISASGDDSEEEMNLCDYAEEMRFNASKLNRFSKLSKSTNFEEPHTSDVDQVFGQFIVNLLKTIPESSEKDNIRVKFIEDLMKYKTSLIK